MKRFLSLLCALAVLLSAAACGSNKTSVLPTDETKAADGVSTDASADSGEETMTDRNGKTIPSNIPQTAVTAIKEYFSSMEYTLYMRVFTYKDENDQSKGRYGDDYVGEKWTKEGCFFKLRDEYNQKDRYYVWGYADETRCCDFQWEFVPEDLSSLPENGSRIKVKGVVSKSRDALDGYWLTKAQVTVESPFEKTNYDYDLTLCSGTLARVQIINMQQHTDVFNGKTMRVFGRAIGTNGVQHPYYDGAWGWQMDLVNAEKTSAPGTYLLLGGTFTAGETGGSYLNTDEYSEVAM